MYFSGTEIILGATLSWVLGMSWALSSRRRLPRQVLKNQAPDSMDRALCSPEAQIPGSPKETELLSAQMLTCHVPKQRPGSAWGDRTPFLNLFSNKQTNKQTKKITTVIHCHCFEYFSHIFMHMFIFVYILSKYLFPFLSDSLVIKHKDTLTLYHSV